MSVLDLLDRHGQEGHKAEKVEDSQIINQITRDMMNRRRVKPTEMGLNRDGQG